MLTETNIVQEVDDFLEHFGRKGMKWGVRKSRPGAFATSKHKHQLNKASRKKDFEKHASNVDKARGRLASGKTKRDWKKAKGEHAANKAKLGGREARKILQKARDKKFNDASVSQQARDGKEVAIILGAGAVGAILAATLSTRGM